MIAACGAFGMTFPCESIIMKDVLRARVTSRHAAGSMCSMREQYLLALLPCEVEPPVVESAARRALDSAAACLRLSSSSISFTCRL